jgi:RHS repeat-associated protein
MTTPNGAATTWDFNADGYITQKVTPDGATTYAKAAGTNELQSVTDPLGRTTSYIYYSTSDVTNGLLHTKTDPLGNVITYEYETTYGMPTKITDALGKITTMTHTIDPGTGRVTQTVTTDPLANQTTINYNPAGLPASVTDPNSNTTSLYYDDPANPGQVTRIADPLGNTVQYAYDGVGRLASVTDPKGATTTYGYDFGDRVTSVTDPLGSLTRYYYDLNGNLTWLIDPKGNWIKYEYDDRDRITKMTDQLGREEIYGYYRDVEITPTTGDNLKSITDRKGQTTTFDEYDADGRLKQVTYDDGSTTQYVYDAGGRVTQIDDSLSGTIGYAYNDTGCGTCSGSALDRIASETTAAGTVAYTYDTVGRRTKMTFPGATDVTYTRDDAGRLTNVSRTIGGAVKDFTFAYDNGSRRTSQQVGLYKSQGKWKYLKSTYGYDVANHLTSLLHQNPTATIESFTWTFDANGNRKSVSQSASLPLATPLANASYDEANEMLTFGGAALTYDENGNLATRTDACGTTNYTWDARNRLTGISGYKPDCIALTASFSYDALNRRTGKTINGTTTTYVYDGWDIIKETTGSLTTHYTRTLNIDEPLVFERSDGAIRYYKADALGSIIALTDGNGIVKTTYAYDAFGNTSVSGEASVNPFQYAGRENDGTGLYYYRARYYSPGLRRFISEDPIRLAAGINFFSYVGNNPVNVVDPLGLYGTKDCSYYDDMCKRTGSMYYCIFGKNVCKQFPDTDGNWDDCVRQCLPDFDRENCQNPCGEPKFNYTCTFQDAHSWCWFKCLSNPNKKPSWPKSNDAPL